MRSGRTGHKRADTGAKVIAHRDAGKVLSWEQRQGNTGHLRTLPNTGTCVCGQCGHGFYSLHSFDKHQTLDVHGGAVCWDPSSINMARNANGWWVTSLRDMGESS